MYKDIKTMNSPDENVNELCREFINRSHIGFKKYGVTTERTDLDFDHWVQHLKEELMDSLVYIHRIQKERQVLNAPEVNMNTQPVTWIEP
jgi:hypothetical protein